MRLVCVAEFTIPAKGAVVEASSSAVLLWKDDLSFEASADFERSIKADAADEHLSCSLRRRLRVCRRSKTFIADASFRFCGDLTCENMLGT